ncbi:MAG: single-stranded DNA-binding protein [Aquificae bacterium]|nr:single-stranded DNA-binding protein [Aquificota bacterium]
MLNRVFLIGRLTRDPVITYLPSGTPVVEFTVAYNRRYRDQSGEWKEETHFFDVKGYGKSAEDWGTRFSKGFMVLIEGRLVQEKWEREGKTFSKVRILAESVRLVSRPKGAEGEETLSEEEETLSSLEEDIRKVSEGKEESPFGEEDEIPF